MRLKQISSLFTDAIHKKLITSVVLFMVIPATAIYIYTFQWFEKNLIDNVIQSSFNSMTSIRNNLNKTIESMAITSNFVRNDENVIDAISETGMPDYIKNTFEIDKLFSNLKLNYLDKNFLITVISSRGPIYSTWPRNFHDYTFFRDESWYRDCISLKQSFEWIVLHKQYVLNESVNEKYLISFANVVMNPDYTSGEGVVLISIGQSELYRQIFSREPNPYEGEFFLTDTDGRIICHSNQDIVGKNISYRGIDSNLMNGKSGYRKLIMDDSEMLVTYLTMENPGWKIVQLMSYNKVISETKPMLGRIITISILILVLIIIFLLAFSSRIALPVRKLVKVMKEVETGNMDVMVEIGGNDEMNKLGGAFNSMVAKQKDLIVKISEEERARAVELKKKEQMRFEMLMAQINPHFLFNTLNTIKWTAIMSGAATVGKMVSSLGNLLEMSINRGNDIITLAEEIENIKSYVYIQKIRFDGRFDIIYKIENGTMNCRVPKFILQPLIENSFIHGFDSETVEGRITITTVKKDEKLVITVADNGKGMDAGTVSRLMDMDGPNTDRDRMSGIGVGNVNQRIKLYCGKEYGLLIKSEAGKGTEIEIILSWHEGEEIA